MQPRIEPPQLSDREFERIRHWMAKELGIQLVETKRPLVVARLSPRLRALGMTTFEEYLAFAWSDATERERFIDRLTTHETSFFRESRQFEHLEEHVFPAWRTEMERGERPRTLRAWSCACSTGEEPFSIAMSLAANFPEEQGFSVDVVASDISRGVLETARDATWPIARAKEIPDRYRNAFMLRGTGPQLGWMRASANLRRLVRFATVNLHDEHWAIGGTFDLVFCRNVLIYFTGASRERVTTRLLERLNRGGLLLLGHAESLHGRRGLRAVAPNVYALSHDGGRHGNP